MFSKISEEDYNGLMETLYLCSIPNMRERIMSSINTSVDECVAEEEVDW